MSDERMWLFQLRLEVETTNCSDIIYSFYHTLAGLLVTSVTQPRVKLGKKLQLELLTKEERGEQQHPTEHFWVRTYVALSGFSDFTLCPWLKLCHGCRGCDTVGNNVVLLCTCRFTISSPTTWSRQLWFPTKEEKIAVQRTEKVPL